MTDPRKPIFDALRTALGGKLGADDVTTIDAMLDRLGVPKEAALRKTSQKGIDLIHSFESLVLTAYKDPGPTGLPITIGWGSTTDENGAAIKLGTTWTKERADARFVSDLAKFEASVNALLGSAPTTQSQFDALVSFGYNVGTGDGGLKTSTLLRKHKEGDYAGAKAEFARWNKSGGAVLAGLTRRRAAEAALYGA
jgi:lysozyme